MPAGRQPFAQPGGLPVENTTAEKRTAQSHDEPVAVNGRPQRRAGNVEKILHTKAPAAAEGLEPILEHQQQFSPAHSSDVRKTLREAAVHVVTVEVLAFA